MKLKNHDMKLLKIKEVTPNVFLCEFPTKYLLTSTFLRFQEHYESPKFRGKFFTMEDYEDYYAEEFGNFDYYQTVVGCNFTSKCVQAFIDSTKKYYDIEKQYMPLRKKEMEFIDKFKKKTKKDFSENFYIIGIVYGDKVLRKNITHEVAHGLFNTNPEYKKNVRKIMKKYENVDYSIVEEYLYSKRYHEWCFEDEIHAYMMGNISYFVKRFKENKKIKGWKKKLKAFKKVSKELKENLNLFYKEENNE